MDTNCAGLELSSTTLSSMSSWNANSSAEEIHHKQVRFDEHVQSGHSILWRDSR